MKHIEPPPESIPPLSSINLKDIAASKLDALNMLLGRYQSQRRLEEAVIVQRLIKKEESKLEDYGQGLHQDM